MGDEWRVLFIKQILSSMRLVKDDKKTVVSNVVHAVWRVGVVIVSGELKFCLQAFHLTSTLGALSTARYAPTLVPRSACPVSRVKVDSTTDTKVQAITPLTAHKPSSGDDSEFTFTGNLYDRI